MFALGLDLTWTFVKVTILPRLMLAGENSDIAEQQDTRLDFSPSLLFRPWMSKRTMGVSVSGFRISRNLVPFVAL
jgi:hypothetical protein